MNATAQLSICIIEDDAHFRETLTDAMSLWDVEVRGSATAADGLETLRLFRPSVIVVDVRLPDMNGLELCRRIRRNPRLLGVPVILISGSARYNDPRDRVEGLLAGAAAFLPKPISIEELWAEMLEVVKIPEADARRRVPGASDGWRRELGPL